VAFVGRPGVDFGVRTHDRKKKRNDAIFLLIVSAQVV